MKKFSVLTLLAVMILSLAMVFTACSSSDDPPPPPPPPPPDGVQTTVFDLVNNDAIQALTPGAITFPTGENPIAPLVKAGEIPEHVTGWQAVSTEDGKIALQYTTVATWGVGIDLPYATFGFKVGDVVTVTGTVVSGSGTIQLNSNVGGENSIASHSGGGDFTLTATLTASNVSQIAGGSPAGIRIEARAANMTIKITGITIVGLRPATAVQLAAPVIEVTEHGISWEAVEGATGYKVYADDELLETLVALTSIDLNSNDDLEPGEHDIYVIATGPAGYTDSPASNVVTYDKPVPVVHTINITVAGVAQEVIIKPVFGDLEVLEGANGYTLTKGRAYAGSYAWFGVTFTGTDRLSDFGTVTLNWKGGAGDIGYKNLSLVASATAFSGNLPNANTVNAQWWNSSTGSFDSGPQVNGTTGVARTLIITAEKAATYTGSTVYFCIFENANLSASNVETVFTISDIEFVKGTPVAKSSATLDAISVKTKPTKETYVTGEAFAPAGLVITKKMLYGTTGTGFAEDVPYDASTFTFKDSANTAITTSTILQTTYPDRNLQVTVVYTGKVATFDLVVGTVTQSAFDAATGMTTGIGAQGSATFADGIIDLTTTGSSALFTVAATGATSTSTITIKYICKVTTGSAQVILKNGGWGTDLLVANGTDGLNWYPTLTADAVSTLVVKGSYYTNPATGIWFQRNGDTNAFKIKILEVTVEE